MQLNDYSNPNQLRIVFCPPLQGGSVCNYVCCDSGPGACTSGGRRCDTFFIFCLRPLRAGSGLGCNSGTVLQSRVNVNDATIDFSQSSFLGLNNPFTLPGLTNNWNVSCSDCKIKLRT